MASVVVDDGAELPADVVVVGVGAIPNTDLADAAGLEVDNGVVVDHALRTSAPDMFAAGDVANVVPSALGRHVRVEHWANALQRRARPPPGRCSGRTSAYDRGAVLLHRPVRPRHGVRGLGAPGDDQVVFRGDLDGGEFIAFWLRGRAGSPPA